MDYAELQVTSHFSFLRGASSCAELFAQAKLLGIKALAITDRHSLAGIVRAHEAAREHGVRLIIGTRIDLEDGTTLLLYPEGRAGYARLCRLLSLGKARAGKGQCQLFWEDVEAWREGLVAILVPDEADERTTFQLARLRRLFGKSCYIALTLRRRPGDALRLEALERLGSEHAVPAIVTNDVLYHEPRRRILQDVVTCIREGTTIDAAGFRKERFADRHLKAPEEMARLFARHPRALARTNEVMRRCSFSLDELTYQYPLEEDEPGLSAQATLERRVEQHLPGRYPEGAPEKVCQQIAHELALIGRLGYAPYFLTVHAIVRFARSQNILCQGRGSAANSTVCYVLGITSIDPAKNDLLFERFVSEERREPPDIDVDFEHERREEVIQWIYERYGRHRAALTAVVTRYRTRGAIRDVGKVMGLSEDVIAALSGQAGHWDRNGLEEEKLAGIGLNLEDRRLRMTLELARELMGFPRHLSQHPGGFVLTETRLDELVPVEPAAMENRQTIEWDKDDIDLLKFMKVDVLGLGMLGCLRRAFALMESHKAIPLELATVPPEDPATYRMIQKADTIGVFQIESRAQMSMLPRLKPKDFYDLVIEIAIVRPGPIQGNMVHPYLRRRENPALVDFQGRDELKEVLGKTLGVPLFQEQAMRIAMVCAGFSATQSDGLRRAMATFKNTGTIGNYREMLISGMLNNKYSLEFAESIFRQLEGFSSYGFPESHSASFALLAYASSWLKCHHPEVFAAALLNSQPMGFYAPAQIVADARRHGVEVRPVCVNTSFWDNTLEPLPGRNRKNGCSFALRLGLREVKGLSKDHADRLAEMREAGPFRDIPDLWRRAGIPVEALRHLADADAFLPALGKARREALWEIRGLPDEPLPLFAAAGADDRQAAPDNIPAAMALPVMPAPREMMEDYRHTGLSLRRHPLSWLRREMAARRVVPAAELKHHKDGERISIAGIVLVRQRPGSASGVMFMTLEDETGCANAIIWPALFEQQRPTILAATLALCHGRLQIEGDVIHVVAQRVDDLSSLLHSLDREAEASLAGDAPLTIRSRDFR
jgi:error-prone DNA polymerase